MQTLRWHTISSLTDLQRTLADKICTLANACIAEKNSFSLVLAGGTTPRDIYAQLRSCKTDWARWQIYFGDERCLPIGDADHNDSMARAAWLDHVDIPPHNIHAIPAHLPSSACIVQYTETLKTVPAFDLVLLGLGEDGHTASLFPNQDWGSADDAPALLAVSDAPKPPAARISLSARRLSLSNRVWFIVAGLNKRDAIARWQAGEKLPASAIRPANGVDIFIVDHA